MHIAADAARELGARSDVELATEAGIASAMVNTSQQIGGSVGTSLLSTIYATAVTSYAGTHRHVAGLAAAAQVHGDTTAFWWAGHNVETVETRISDEPGAAAPSAAPVAP